MCALLVVGRVGYCVLFVSSCVFVVCGFGCSCVVAVCVGCWMMSVDVRSLVIVAFRLLFVGRCLEIVVCRMLCVDDRCLLCCSRRVGFVV